MVCTLLRYMVHTQQIKYILLHFQESIYLRYLQVYRVSTPSDICRYIHTCMIPRISFVCTQSHISRYIHTMYDTHDFIGIYIPMNF
jgi:hypothetical protein